MANYYRRCSNRLCPRYLYTGEPYQTDAKDALWCPICNTNLPKYNLPSDDTDQNPAPSSEATQKKEKQMEKTKKYTLLQWFGIIILAIVATWIMFAGVHLISRWMDNQQNANTQQSQPIASLENTAYQAANVAAPINEITTTNNSNVDTSGQITEQAYFWHARFYEETGIGKTKTWKNVVVHDDEYLVVGGTIVNGVDEGVYQGYGPGTYTIKVTDGLIAIVDDDWGSLEFNFRVNQAITYGWAHAHIDRGPIPNN